MTRYFSSQRECRLWSCVIVVVVAIYSTLGLSATLVRLVDEDLLAITFLACLILVCVVVLTQGLKLRPGGIELGVAIGIAVVYVLLGVRMAVPERSHLMEYGVLAVLVYEAINERVKNGYGVPSPAVTSFLAASLIGMLDECIQAILPNRVFDWNDILFNVLAVLFAIIGMVTLQWSRGRVGSHRNMTRHEISSDESVVSIPEEDRSDSR